MRHFGVVRHFRLGYYLSIAVLVVCIIDDASARGKADQPYDPESYEKKREIAPTEYPPYLSLQDGLHVTGTPIEINIESFRLELTDLVGKPGNYTFEEVKEMPRVEIIMTLVCPGFFEDISVWTGTPLLPLLKKHGINENARWVRFIWLITHTLRKYASMRLTSEQYYGMGVQTQ